LGERPEEVREINAGIVLSNISGAREGLEEIEKLARSDEEYGHMTAAGFG
jgi:hypothetical protein